MIVKSIYEVVIHLESFRNIELYYQGLYLIRLQLYDSQKENLVAHPYAHCQSYNPYESEHQKIYDAQILRPAFIVDQTSSFYSKSFIIKYCEEEVQINDFVHFRIEYELAEQDASQLTLEAGLYFYDYMNSKNNNEKEIKEEQFEERLLSTAKCVSTKKFQISSCFRGLHEAHSILFDEHYFCEVKMAVHTMCLDRKLRASNLQLSDFAKLSAKQKLQLIEETKKIDKKQANLLNSVCSMLNIRPDGNLEPIERILLQQLKENYHRLHTHCQQIMSKCILQKQRKVFQNHLELPVLKLQLQEDKLARLRLGRDRELYLQTVMAEVACISGQLLQLWHKCLDINRISPRLCILYLQKEWTTKQKQLWKCTVLKKPRNLDDLSQSIEWPDAEKERYVSDVRNRKSQQGSVVDLTFLPASQQLPIIFHESYNSRSHHLHPHTEDYKGIHLFVFVHGFQGNSYDMKMIKNYVSFRHPESLFLCSSSNQDQTNGDILEMGQRLANQVKDYIRDNCPQETLGRLSFLGHSLGGLKIRAALPYLSEFRQKMYTYISFSSPHLGLLYNTSSLIDAGIWFLNKMKNSLCLKQLSLEDAEHLKDTALYKLSEMPGLKWFKHVMLFGSKQDSYSPFESSRMEVCRGASLDKKYRMCYFRNGQVYTAMAKRLLSDIEPSRLHRMDVSFCIQQRNLDSFIGRTAHILFLECQPLIKSIIFNFQDIFQ